MSENSKLAILCISEELLLRDILGDALCSQSLEVVTTDSYEYSREYVEKHNQQLIAIIVDWNNKNGSVGDLDFRRSILKFHEIPFIVISDTLSQHASMEALKLKIAGFIEKPIDAETFFEQIELLIAERRENLMEQQILWATYEIEGDRILNSSRSDLTKFSKNTDNRQYLNAFLNALKNIRLMSSVLKKTGTQRLCQQFEVKVLDYIMQEGPITHVQIIMLESCLHTLTVSWHSENKNGMNYSDRSQNIDLQSAEQEAEKKIRGLSETDLKNEMKYSIQKNTNRFNISGGEIEYINEILGETVIQKNLLEKKLSKMQHALPNHDTLMESLSHLTEMNRYQSILQEKLSALRVQKFDTLISPIIDEISEWEEYFKKQAKIKVLDHGMTIFQKSASVVYDCIKYLIRNSIEHGIESPETRRDLGKQEFGTIEVGIREMPKAYIISVADDGGGIDIDQLKGRLASRGLASLENLDNLDDSEILNFQFASSQFPDERSKSAIKPNEGFAYLNQIVKAAGGNLTLDSSKGIGTTCSIYLPKLSMSTSEVVIVVSTGTDLFGINQANVRRMISVRHKKPDEFFAEEGGLAFLFEEKIISLVSLSKVLSGSRDVGVRNSEDLEAYSDIIVVKGDKDAMMALLVEKVIDSEEIVNRRLSQVANEQSIFCGAAILGDSKIGLIIDAEALSRFLNDKNTLKESNFHHNILMADEFKIKSDENTPKNPKTAIMVFRTLQDSLYGIEHKYIDRVEYFLPHHIKKVANDCIAIFRESTINLLNIEDYLKTGDYHSSLGLNNLIENNEMGGEGIFTLIAKSERDKLLAFAIQEVVDTIEVGEDEYWDSEIKQRQFSGHFLYKEELVAIISASILGNSTAVELQKSLKTDQKKDHKIPAAQFSDPTKKGVVDEIKNDHKVEQDENNVAAIDFSERKKEKENMNNSKSTLPADQNIDLASGWGLFD